MKKIFLMIMFLCTHAYAATMCVPDMGSCTSCTDATYNGLVWSATCCGVQVSGVGVFYSHPTEWNDLVGAYVCLSRPEQTTISMNSCTSADSVNHGCGMCACFMIKPYILENGVAFDPYEQVRLYDPEIGSYLTQTITKSCSRICSERVASVIGALF